VMVGAVRPATAISADGPLNLYNAVKVASYKESHGKGVLVVLNDRIGSARFITKMNTTMVDSFKALEQGYIGSLVGGKVYYFYKDVSYPHTLGSVFDIKKIDDLPRVSIIYSHQGDERFMYDAAVQARVKGIIVATAGGYTLSGQARSGIHDALDQGLIVVRSSRLNAGIVSRTPMDDQSGYITSESLNPAKARILLMLALESTKDRDKIQKYFQYY